MIRGVVFDCGGVITATAIPELAKAKMLEHGLPWEVAVSVFAEHRRSYDVGDIDIHELYSRVWDEAGIAVPTPLALEIAYLDTKSFLQRNEDLLPVMREIRRLGFKIGLLTNMPLSFYRMFCAHYSDFTALTDVHVVSGIEKIAKPDPAIYGMMSSRIGLKPEELLFVDDSEQNCKEATDLGWQAIQFRDNEQTSHDIFNLITHGVDAQ